MRQKNLQKPIVAKLYAKPIEQGLFAMEKL
jgi:hypothetical protein